MRILSVHWQVSLSWDHLILSGFRPLRKAKPVQIDYEFAVSESCYIFELLGSQHFVTPGVLKSEDAALQFENSNVGDLSLAQRAQFRKTLDGASGIDC